MIAQGMVNAKLLMKGLKLIDAIVIMDGFLLII